MKTCKTCGTPLPFGAPSVCPSCGSNNATHASDTPSRRKKVSNLAIAYLYSVFFSFVTGVVILIACEIIAHFTGDPDAAMNMSIDTANILTVIAYAVFMAVLFVMNVSRKKNLLDEVHIKPCSLNVLPIAAMFGYTANYVYSLAVALIPWPEDIIEDHTGAYGELLADDANVLILVFSTAICTGIIEEVVFRGLTMGTLKKSFSPKTAIIVSAVIFGLAHPTVIAAAYSTVLGIFLGILFEKHKSIVPCIVVHIFYNLAACIGYPENGDISGIIIIASLALHLATCLMLFKKSSDKSEI